MYEALYEYRFVHERKADDPYERVFIYVLVDPETDAVRYVGRTNSLGVRWVQHQREAMRQTSGRKARWYAELLKRGLCPRMFVIDETFKMFGVESEQWYINYFRSLEADLLNCPKHMSKRYRSVRAT